jgi:hypothetical protein
MVSRSPEGGAEGDSGPEIEADSEFITDVPSPLEECQAREDCLLDLVTRLVLEVEDP